MSSLDYHTWCMICGRPMTSPIEPGSCTCPRDTTGDLAESVEVEISPYSPLNSQRGENWIYIDMPPGEMEYHNSSVYGQILCETRLRGLCVCSQCPDEEGCCCNITHAKVFFENNPEMYWEYKTAAIIDDVYTTLVFYKSHLAIKAEASSG